MHLRPRPFALDDLQLPRNTRRRKIGALHTISTLTGREIGHWRRSRCRAHAKRCRILREAPTRCCTSSSAKGLAAKIPGQIHGQERQCCTYVYLRPQKRDAQQRCSSEERRDLANMSTAIMHVVGGLLLLGYAQNYYFHLRKFHRSHCDQDSGLTERRSPQEQRPLEWSDWGEMQ